MISMTRDFTGEQHRIAPDKLSDIRWFDPKVPTNYYRSLPNRHWRGSPSVTAAHHGRTGIAANLRVHLKRGTGEWTPDECSISAD
jgi:hypothetical protein